jgi:hypothetical protein
MRYTSTSPLAHLADCQLDAENVCQIYVVEHLPRNPTSRPGVEIIIGEYNLALHLRINPDATLTFERTRHRPAAPTLVKRESRELLCVVPGGVEFVPEREVKEKGLKLYRLRLGIGELLKPKEKKPEGYWKERRKRLKAEMIGVVEDGDDGRTD